MAIGVVDLFCGAGGLSFGLRQRGLKIRGGLDIDPYCRFPFVRHTGGQFIEGDLSEVKASDIKKLFRKTDVRVLAGCAPCQPFSTYALGKADSRDSKWQLLTVFGQLVEKVKPQIVTMENVPGLQGTKIFRDFVRTLDKNRYHVDYSVVSCDSFGLQQTRKRLVLLASKFGPIEIMGPATIKVGLGTVRNSISHLPEIVAGETHPSDYLHRASALSEKNLRRIRVSVPGGSWRDWPKRLVANCHLEDSGTTFSSVYGRMSWDEPSPTITTQFYGFGNGRFGHPEQDRAISLREGAILQSFPADYAFASSEQEVSFTNVGRLVGNSVPVVLGEIIGETISRHVEAIGH